MKRIIIEIKARCQNPDEIRNILRTKNAIYRGKDHQIDTYFRTNRGRLKLREGKIENYLIYYARKNRKCPKQSDVILFRTEPDSSLKEIFAKAFGLMVVVDKHREIYFIENVKFHLDKVKRLGSFVEIEATHEKRNFDKEKLLRQCKYYLRLFKISKKDLISESYSDLLLNKIGSWPVEQNRA